MLNWLRAPRSGGGEPAAKVVALPAPDPDLALRRLEWTSLRRLDGLLHGDYRTLFRGQGLDLADLREYQYGDDVRRIDWNVTARLGLPYVREYHEDRDITAWFLLDLSASVDFGSEGVRKRSVSESLVALLARVLTRRGNRVGALLYGNGVEAIVPAAGGRVHVLRILHAMRSTRSTAHKRTDLSELLRAADHMMRKRSTVFVVSDFYSKPGWAGALGKLALRHELVAVRLYDPLESELPDLGLVPFHDAETGEQLLVDTHDPAFRRRFVEAATRREAALRSAFSAAGVDVLELSTGDELADSIRRFVELRKRRSRVAFGAPRQRAPRERFA